MNAIIIVLLLILVFLIGCQWFCRIKEHKGLAVTVLAISIGVVDFILSRYVLKHPGFIHFMWTKAALLTLVPLLFITGCSFGKWGKLATGMIGTGVALMVYDYHTRN